MPAIVDGDAYCVQIGLKAEWRAHHGRLVLFLGNKNTSTLAFVQVVIPPFENVAFTCS